MIKNPKCGAGEVAQWLRALTAPRGNPGLVLSTYMMAHGCLTPVPKDVDALFCSLGTHTLSVQTYMQAKHIE